MQASVSPYVVLKSSNCNDKSNEEMTTTTTTTTTIPIYFQSDWDIGIGGGLWSTGMIMSQYFIHDHTRNHFIHNILQLCQRQQRCNSNMKSTTTTCALSSSLSSSSDYELSILELGSGNGYVAVCCMAAITLYNQSVMIQRHKQQQDQRQGDPIHNNNNKKKQQEQPLIYIREFTITDYDTEHIHLIQATINKNPHLFCRNEYLYNYSIVQHQWGVFTSHNDSATTRKTATTATTTGNDIVLDGSKKYDLILGSDVVYRDYLYDPFLQSIVQFSHEETISLIGITMTDTKPQFFTVLNQEPYHLRYEKFADHLLESQFRGTTFGIFVIRKKKTN